MSAALKILALTAFLLTVNGGLAQAATSNNVGQILDREWLRCESDNDCTVYYACEDVAVNKLYYDVAKKLFLGCDFYVTHNPNAKTKCVNNFCEVVKPRKK